MTRRILCLILAMALTLCAHAALAEQPAFQNAPVVCAPESQPFAEEDVIFEIFSLNSGASDCFLLRQGEHTMLVDGGIYFDEWRVLRFLQDRGISQVDIMLNTHCHDDHITGLTELLKHGVTALSAYGSYRKQYAGTDQQYFRRWMTQLDKAGIPYTQLTDGDALTLGEAQLSIYRNTSKGLALNDTSLVIKAECGGRTAVLLGDVSSKSCAWLSKNHAADLDAEIVKTNHHAFAPMNTDLLKDLSPAVMLIPNKRTSSTAKALQQYDKYGLISLFAGEGIIRCATNGETWYCELLPHYEKDAD